MAISPTSTPKTLSKPETSHQKPESPRLEQTHASQLRTAGERQRDSADFSREVHETSDPSSQQRLTSLLAGLEALESTPSQRTEPTFDEAVADHYQALLDTADSRRDAVDPEARVALLDSFGPQPGQGHGDAVEYVLQQATPETQPKVQRFQVSPTSLPPGHFFTAPGEASPDERLQAFVEQSALDGLMQTNAVLDTILGDPDSGIRTINQSQGMSPASQARILHGHLYERQQNGDVVLTESGRTILDALGMDSTGGPSHQQDAEFAERATRRIEELFHSSEPLGRELALHSELSEELAQRGVSYVVSAGNDADFGTHMGAELQGGFDDNLFTNPHNITVGALDQTSGLLAGFSSGDPEVDYLAPGVGLRTGDEDWRVASGTSFSAPLVADRLDSLRQQNPEITQQQLLQLLEESFGRQPGGLEHLVIQ